MTRVGVNDFKNLLQRTNEYLNTVPKRIEQLKGEINQYNNELVDIQHFIEFNRVNASLGYKIQADMREVLLKRREAKEELEYLEVIEKRMKNTFKHQEGLRPIVDGISHKDEVISERTYIPRVRHDLFNK